VWLGDLCVARNQRRHGIGRALVAAVQARAAELGCAAVDLELARGNDVALVLRTFEGGRLRRNRVLAIFAVAVSDQGRKLCIGIDLGGRGAISRVGDRRT
jgi:hypothetical protein